MTTHYHALMLSTVGTLSSAMRFISGRFTKLNHLRDGTDGALFRGRYHSVGIDANAHLMQASRYIHLNPVEGKLVPRAIDWRWSSAGAYVSGHDQPTWLHTQSILGMIGGSNPRS